MTPAEQVAEVLGAQSANDVFDPEPSPSASLMAPAAGAAAVPTTGTREYVAGQVALTALLAAANTGALGLVVTGNWKESGLLSLGAASVSLLFSGWQWHAEPTAKNLSIAMFAIGLAGLGTTATVAYSHRQRKARYRR